MALQPITRKTLSEDGEQITTYQKMCDALEFARTKGYYGGISLAHTNWRWRISRVRNSRRHSSMTYLWCRTRHHQVRSSRLSRSRSTT